MMDGVEEGAEASDYIIILYGACGQFVAVVVGSRRILSRQHTLYIGTDISTYCNCYI